LTVPSRSELHVFKVNGCEEGKGEGAVFAVPSTREAHVHFMKRAKERGQFYSRD